MSNNREFHFRESQHDTVTVSSSTFSFVLIHKVLLENITGFNAFFLETDGFTKLNYRQACSVESLSHLNPDLPVNVLFTGGKFDSRAATYRALTRYKNTRFGANEYMTATPLEHWYHHTD